MHKNKASEASQLKLEWSGGGEMSPVELEAAKIMGSLSLEDSNVKDALSRHIAKQADFNPQIK